MNRQPSPKRNGLPAVIFWTAVWYLAAWLMDNPLLLPYPLQVLRCLGSLMGTAEFWQTVAVTIGRILLGVTSAVALGCVLAVATTSCALLDALIAPAMTAMQATPVASFTILVLIWVDRNYIPALICGMMVLPVVWNSVSTGIRVTDPQLLEMAQVYRFSRFQILRRIYIPSVMPFFRTACVSSIGLGWKAGIAAEVLTVPKRSIGRMIADSKLYVMTEELFASTLVVIVLSLLLQKIMLRLLQGRDGHA